MSAYRSVQFVLRERAGLVAASVGLMVVTPYLGSLPVRSIPAVVALAQADGGATSTATLAWPLSYAGDGLTAALVALIAAGAAAFALALVSTRLLATLSARATQDLRLQLHRQLLATSPAELREGHRANMTRTALLEQSRVAAMFASNTVPAAVGVVAAVVIWAHTLYSAIGTSGQTGAGAVVVLGVVAALLTINIAAVWFSGKRTEAAQRDVIKEQAAFIGAVGESVDHLAELQLNNAEVAQQGRLSASLSRMTRAQIRVATYSGLAAASSRGVVLLGIPLLVVAWKALSLEAASLAVMVPALLMLQRSISSVGSLVTSAKVSRPAIELVSEYMGDGDAGALSHRPASGDRVDGSGALHFADVEFARDGNHILRGVDLAVNAGETLAIVGKGGSGKSTLLRLAVGIERPDNGTVVLDGADIGDPADMPLSELRRRVGILRQHPSFFARTLRENLLLGVDGAGVELDDDIERALTISHAVEIAERIGLGGTIAGASATLSGSERRRLALARLLLRDPDVYLLDELEAGLPQSLATQLFDDFRAATRGRTCVLVTHRPDLLSTDRVAFLAEGSIVDVAPHAELMTEFPAYRELCAENQQETADE